MAESFFIVLAVALLYVLFRPGGLRSLRSGRVRVRVALLGVALIAVPGIITLAANIKPSRHSSIPPVRGVELTGEVLVPAKDPVGIEEARAVLFRIFTVVKGIEEHPVDFWQSVQAMGEHARFELKGGYYMTVAMMNRDGTVLDYRIHHPLGSSSGQMSFSTDDSIGLESGHAAYTELFELPNLDFAVMGSLLHGGNNPVRICICAILVRAVAEMPVADWWEAHGDEVRSIIDRRPSLKDSSVGQGFLTTNWNSGYGLLILLGGSLLLLFACHHKMRCFCGLLIMVSVYSGAMDSLVLRIQSTRLNDEDPLKARAAVVEVAGTRMHPVSAAGHLLDLARSDGDPQLRACALRCMNRAKLLDTLITMEGAVSRLNVLKSDEDLGVSKAAEELLALL